MKNLLFVLFIILIGSHGYAQNSTERTQYDQEKELKLKVHNAKQTKNSELVLSSKKQLVEFQLQALDFNSEEYKTKQVELIEIEERLKEETQNKTKQSETNVGNNAPKLEQRRPIYE